MNRFPNKDYNLKYNLHHFQLNAKAFLFFQYQLPSPTDREILKIKIN